MSRLPRNYLLGLLAGLLLLLVASVAPAPTKPSLPPKLSPMPSPVLRVSAPTMPSSPSPPPTFAGTVFPTPPQQKSPWTPPAGLPDPLVSAATTLFDQGLADPRGGDYRQISVAVGNVWSGDGGVARTHGWALPASTSGGGRFAVCWNGLVYPVVSVGGPADLNADVDTLVQADAKIRSAFVKANPTGSYFRFMHGAIPEGESVSETSFLPIKVCLLLRLGEGDLARTFWDAWLSGTPPRHNGNDEALRDPYLTLADEWVWALFDRAVTAHMRGDDRLAVLDARHLTALQPVAEAEARRRGYPQYPNGGVHEAAQPYFPYLGPLPRLLADEERRAGETTPRPTLTAILAMPDKAARIAALIRALDQVSARQNGQPGGVSPDADPVVQGLVAQGDAAVQPLIDAVRTDTRLTRSVGFGRDFFQARSLVSVSGAAYAALVDILHTSEFSASPPTWEGRAETAAAIQAYWDKYHGFSVAERWYRTLADDGAAPKQWLDAAQEIVRPGDEEVRGGWVVSGPRPNGIPPPPHGESLRRGHTPSVSALMARRVAAIVALSETRDHDSRQVFDVGDATTMALSLASWDPQAARPVLRAQFGTERKTLAFWKGKVDVTNDALRLTKLTLARVQSGDPAALSDYLDWLQGTPLKDLPSFRLSDILEPLWRSPDDPVVMRGAAFLFNDPRSPWVPLIQERPGFSTSEYENLLESPLLGLAPFRRAVLTALADHAVIQSVTLGGPDRQADFQIIRHDVDPFRPAAPQEFPVRRCDLYAWHLSHLDGMPAFGYTWPAAEKDAAIAAAAARLRRYGSRFGAGHPVIRPGEGGFGGPNDIAFLTFPRLTRPATAGDVAGNRAIFTLEAGARVVPLPAFPLPARWVTDHRYPRRVGVWSVARKKYEPGLGYSQDGNVWQAEETADGKRFYGFVGPHDIARVPAEDMKFPPPPYVWTPVSDGLDGGLRGAAGDSLPYNLSLRAGEPLPLILRLRSRRGLAQTVPADFLRRHLTLNLIFSPDDPGADPRTLTDPARTWEVVRPRRAPPLPPARARRLEPTEDFAAWTLDPHADYDLSRPGAYRLQFLFAARPTESGAPTPEAAFRVTR